MMKNFPFLPFLVFLAGFLLTEVVTILSFKDLKLIKQQAFENTCDEYKNKILSQLNANAQVLYSSAAYIISSDSITRAEWKLFQNHNKSLSELPGILGIGYAKKIKPEQLDQFEKLIQNEGFHNFKVRPEGAREYYTSILFLEPFTEPNQHVIGYDGLSEPVRKKAMLLAEKRNEAVISDKLILIQDSISGKTPSTIMYVPVLKNGVISDNDSISHILIGWVFSPFRMNDLIAGVFSGWKDEKLNLAIYDNEDINPDALLFDSDSILMSKKTDRFYSVVEKLEFNNKIWTLHFTKYQTIPDYFSTRVFAVFSTGFIISLLLFFLALNWLKMKNKSDKIALLNTELEKSSLNKDRFISVLAHDLRSPFNSLLGFTELLNDKFEMLNKTEQKNYIKYIYDSAHSIFRLLDDLLTWARLDAGKFPFNPAKTNLGDICKSVAEDYSIVALKKKITLETRCDDDQFVVFADEMMLKTIIRNLVDNAIKFSPENGVVKIELTKAENKTIVSVTDNGIGMSAEEKSKLFNISTLKSRLGTANEKGTGMGLILCSDLVKRHDGSIWIDSETGKGTTVSFSLPDRKIIST